MGHTQLKKIDQRKSTIFFSIKYSKTSLTTTLIWRPLYKLGLKCYSLLLSQLSLLLFVWAIISPDKHPGFCSNLSPGLFSCRECSKMTAKHPKRLISCYKSSLLEFRLIHKRLQSTKFTSLQHQLVKLCICAKFLDRKLSEKTNYETPECVLTKARVPSKICYYANYGFTPHLLMFFVTPDWRWKK